ncbi:hypothetical protein ACIPW5_11640 [Streptomyces sp. NPDC090077]|uniref:hypothetical protein n=1 Tax=Streptomyces sp. NPDC090077 TaxID=3365938 RepID=UPI0038157EDD
MSPDCPRCGSALTALSVTYRRNRWGGAPPSPRPEQWWRCTGCGWLGHRRGPDLPLHPMRLLEGDEGTCPFCGEEDSNAVGEPWETDTGELRDWLVCLSCGTSNPRRLGPPGGA